MKNTLKKMEIEMKSAKLSEENFPSLFKELESLNNNVYQECLLPDEDLERSSRSKTQKPFQDGEEIYSNEKTLCSILEKKF